MSTYYSPLQPIRFDALFDGCLESFGVREQSHKHSTEDFRLLTDGNNFLWAEADKAGLVSGFVWWVPCGAPGRILAAVAEVFATRIVSEHQPEFHGYQTQEEWDAAMERTNQKYDDELYQDLMNYVRGEPHTILPGTVGMGWAEAAKALIAANPELALPDRKEELLKAVREDEGVEMPISETVRAWAKAFITHEDDLPRA